MVHTDRTDPVIELTFWLSDWNLQSGYLLILYFQADTKAEFAKEWKGEGGERNKIKEKYTEIKFGKAFWLGLSYKGSITTHKFRTRS